jgi:ABC-type branched-subunit amino acid transport system substrate-binding protein
VLRRPIPVVLAAIVLALMLGVAACGDDDDDGGGGGGGEKSLDLTIGDSVPLTGDLADFGPPGRKAADLAVDEIRKAVKEAGVDHKVTISHADNETDPQAAVQAARKLVADGATCLAGAWASADTIPTARSVTIREGVLQITPASTGDAITDIEDDGLLNRTAPPDRIQGPTLAKFIDQELGGAQGKTLNLGARNDAYGTGLVETFGNAWKERGGKVGKQVVYDPKQPSYNSEAGQLTEGSPDAWAIFDFPETYVKVGPALVRTGNWDATKTFVTDGLASSSLPKDAGSEATEGLRGTFPGAPDKGSPAKPFDELYKRTSGPKERQTFDAQNFDAVHLCYLAAVAAGSTDGEDMAAKVREISAPPGKDYSYLQMADAIKALQNGDDINWNGASGQIDMDDKGDATAGVYDLYRYRDGAVDITGELPIEPTQ